MSEFNEYTLEQAIKDINKLKEEQGLTLSIKPSFYIPNSDGTYNKWTIGDKHKPNFLVESEG